MGDTNSIVNVDAKAISQVGIALIDKVADAIGGLYKPHQIVRLAKAQAKADLITAEAQTEIDALRSRALERFVAEEAKKQSNIEEITQKAIPLLENSSEPRKLDDDWVSNFFDKCRIISDDDMQQLWSKVLSGEVNNPGNFRKRTINILADLDKNDAELFVNLCKYCWMINGVKSLIFDVNDSIYSFNGINFSTISHLESLGLLHFNSLSSYNISPMPDKFFITYYGRALSLEKREGADPSLSLGHVILTNAGQQLATICGSKAVEGFFRYAVKKFEEQSYISVTNAGDS